MKILNVNETLELARRCDLPDYDKFEKALIKATDDLAAAIADHMGIAKGETTSEPLDYDGLCASFGPAFPGQPMPEEFTADADEEDSDPLDEGGDWE